MTKYDRENIIGVNFFDDETTVIAQKLLGVNLVHESKEGITSGIIVETEAYLNSNDPACHAFKGKTRRNEAMFGPAGTAYVYLIYGNHYCFNIVTNHEGIGEAILIRALEPLQGIELMKKRRSPKNKLEDLTTGPGKLCAAMNITKDHDKICLLSPPLYLARGYNLESNNNNIGVSTRVGISKGKDKPWRFYLKNNKFVPDK